MESSASFGSDVVEKSHNVAQKVVMSKAQIFYSDYMPWWLVAALIICNAARILI
jgi:hypothetical protein